MWRLIAGRVTQAVAALLILSVIVFAASRLTGDPRALLISNQVSKVEYNRIGDALGLNRSYPVQYGIFLRNALTGDFGSSYLSDQPVAPILWQKLSASGELAAAAIILSWMVGVPLGVIAARRRGTIADKAVMLVALFGQSMPSFWVGVVLIEVFAVRLRWLPSGGRGGLSHLVLPAITLALFGIAGIAVLLRSGMLDVMDAEFITLARAKGIPERVIVWKHALRNALLPVISFAGLYFVNTVTLAIVIEVVFAWPGIGQLTYNAILTRDYPMIQGVVLLAGAISIFGNALTDVAYSFADPRIRYGNN